MNILNRIIEHKMIEVSKLKQSTILNQPINVYKCRSLINNIKNSSSIAIIAEIKKGSPSKGLFAPNLDIVSQARRFEELDASCISVLTDEKFFYGSPCSIKTIRNHTKLPILFKDFIIDEIQIKQAKLLGADVVLLIKRILSKEKLRSLISTARELNLEVLVEVHTKKEFDEISDLDFKLCGINNRSLKDFSIDFTTALILCEYIKKHNKLVITESGIKSKKDLLSLRPFVDGALIGETLSINPQELQNFHIRKKPIEVKICGITDSETAIYCDRNSVDFIGLVFAESSRKINIAQANRIIKHIKTSKIVGVFKDQTESEINYIYNSCSLDYVQVHGDIDEDQLLINYSNLIRAFDYDSIGQSNADIILIDSKEPGSGQSFPIPHYNGDKKVMLAGGINSSNVASRSKKSGACIVDLSSSLETNGVKDFNKINEFLEAIGGI